MLFVRTTHDWAGGGIVYSGGKNDRQTAALVRTGDLFRSTCLTFFSSLSLSFLHSWITITIRPKRRKPRRCSVVACSRHELCRERGEESPAQPSPAAEACRTDRHYYNNLCYLSLLSSLLFSSRRGRFFFSSSFHFFFFFFLLLDLLARAERSYLRSLLLLLELRPPPLLVEGEEEKEMTTGVAARKKKRSAPMATNKGGREGGD